MVSHRRRLVEAGISTGRLRRIGNRHEKSSAQVALRWFVQQDGVVAIPKASSRSHLAENLAVFDFTLTDEEMARIDARNGGLGIRLRNRVPSLVRRLPV